MLTRISLELKAMESTSWLLVACKQISFASFAIWAEARLYLPALVYGIWSTFRCWFSKSGQHHSVEPYQFFGVGQSNTDKNPSWAGIRACLKPNSRYPSHLSPSEEKPTTICQPWYKESGQLYSIGLYKFFGVGLSNADKNPSWAGDRCSEGVN